MGIDWLRFAQDWAIKGTAFSAVPKLQGETMRTMAQAFNEWMRRYTEAPEQYEREFQTVGRYLFELKDGMEPTYGDTCTFYLADLMTGKL